jgi:hypothetical protein
MTALQSAHAKSLSLINYYGSLICKTVDNEWFDLCKSYNLNLTQYDVGGASNVHKELSRLGAVFSLILPIEKKGM